MKCTLFALLLVFSIAVQADTAQFTSPQGAFVVEYDQDVTSSLARITLFVDAVPVHSTEWVSIHTYPLVAMAQKVNDYMSSCADKCSVEVDLSKIPSEKIKLIRFYIDREKYITLTNVTDV